MRLAWALMFAVVAWLAFVRAGAVAAAPQTLQIDLRADGMQVDASPRYTQLEPIAVRVTSLNGATAELVGVSPRGSTLRVPLVRGADGAYTATLTLPVLGTWSFAVATSLRPGTAPTTGPTVPIVVAEAGSSDDAATAMAALAIASIGGGIGLIAIGRKRAVATRA